MQTLTSLCYQLLTCDECISQHSINLGRFNTSVLPTSRPQNCQHRHAHDQENMIIMQYMSQSQRQDQEYILPFSIPHVHMSFPPSLVDIADSRIISVIAWKLNIHYKLWRYKITVITASRAYLLQTPTCTRVNNLVNANALYTFGTLV